jgi:PAS domain S-box-containing protein
MYFRTNKRTINILFALAFLCINVFFVLLKSNLDRAELDNEEVSESVRNLINLESVRKHIRQSELDLRQLDSDFSEDHQKSFRLSMSILLNDSSFFSSSGSDDIDISIDSIRSYFRLLHLYQQATAKVEYQAGPALREIHAASEKTIFRLRSDILLLEEEYQARLLKYNSDRMDFNLRAEAKFMLLAILFNFLLLVFYYFIIRNFRDQEIHDLQLQSQVSAKTNELDNVYERITDAFVSFDNDWNYVHVNSKAAEYHGMPAAELIGKNIWIDFPDLVKEPFYDALMEAKTKRHTIRLELYYAARDIWFEDLIYPTDDGLSVYYHDITEKKKAELALRQSEKELKTSNERYQLISKATNDALWDWDIQKDQIIGNETFNKLMNIEEGQAVRRAFFLSRVQSDDINKIQQNFENSTKSGSTYVIDEFRIKLPEEQFCIMFNRGYLLYDGSGKPYRMLGAMQDITNQKLSRQRLLIEKELSDSIINSLPGVFYLFNRKGKLYRWNRNFEAVTGYTPEEIVKLHPLDFFVPSEQELISNKIQSVFKNGNDSVEAKLLTRYNSEIPYYFNGMKITYEGEECLMGVGTDLTERVKAHNELRELSKSLQHASENERAFMAREIHDELGQQLTGLKMDVSWLKRKLADSDEEIKLKISDILSLIDETVKNIRRISTRLRPRILDDLGLIAALEWQTDEFRKRSETDIEFVSNVEHVDLPTEIATGLFRVYQECLTNVSRHAGATAVESSFTLENGMIYLEICDNGKGFEEGIISGKKTLGLLGMKERTLLMGGTYQIHSDTGKGTRVLVTVPMPKSESYDKNTDR